MSQKQERSDVSSKAAHTPTPWSISPLNGRACVGYRINEQINVEESEANAEFIVRAVNMYEKLLLAVKGYRQYLALDGRPTSELDELIAKAEGNADADR